MDDDIDATSTEICGYNVLKVARYANLIVGVALTVVGGINIFNIFGDASIFSSLNLFLLNIFDL